MSVTFKSPYKEAGLEANIRKKKSKSVNLDLPTEKEVICLRDKKYIFNKKIDYKRKTD